jgi:ribosomal protein S18 acetylase RimI-like enzyme
LWRCRCASRRTHAQARPTCRLLYLHVITHNDAALAFYARHQFRLRKHERSFYVIKGELAPVPGQVRLAPERVRFT